MCPTADEYHHMWRCMKSRSEEEHRKISGAVQRPHAYHHCDCISRLDTFTVRGVDYPILTPGCVSGGAWAPIRGMADTVEGLCRYRIINYDQVHRLAERYGLRFYSVLEKVKPCYEGLSQNRNYYVARDVMDAIRPLIMHCFLCERTIRDCYRDFDPHQFRFYFRAGDPLALDVDDVTVCNRGCRDKITERNSIVIRLQDARLRRYRRQKKVINQCKAQMRALREFLKTGDPEPLRSHMVESPRPPSSPT
jgi:hypothetical protein